MGVEPCMAQCVDVGSVEYWMKLKTPITHSAKLYQVYGYVHTRGYTLTQSWVCMLHVHTLGYTLRAG